MTPLRDRLWLWFVRMALGCALGPGLGLAILMAWQRRTGGASAWEPGLVQIHALALLMGWGSGMILGVGLHFLPRLRGVRLLHAGGAAVCFWFLTGGLLLRMGGQLILVAGGPARDGGVGLCNGMVGMGVILQAAGVCGLVGILLRTFLAGRPLGKNQGFRQVVPLLLVAGSALLLAQGVWCVGIFQALCSGFRLAVLPPNSERMAVDLLLFGFVPAIGLAMSSRLFPLTFGTRTPHPGFLTAGGIFLAGGMLLNLADWVTGRFPGWAGGLQACGLFCGAFAIRIFHPRRASSRERGSLPGGSAGWGVLMAYGWLLVASVALLVFAWQQTAPDRLPGFPSKNMARHAMGIGYMTLLILSVGWKMLPGFAGTRPRGSRILAGTMILGNLGVLARLLAMWPGSPSKLLGGAGFLLLAGLLTFAALGAFSGILFASLIRTKSPGPAAGSQ